MYLRRHQRKKNGVSYQYWTLVESVRTARGPRQRTVATIGKLAGLDKNERIGWESISNYLSGKAVDKQEKFFDETSAGPQWATVDLRGIQVERLRRFGDVFLALVLWKRLELDQLFRSLIEKGGEDIEWDAVVCLLVIARFCEPSSELAIAESFYGKTALEDLVGIPPDKVNENRLYRALDEMLPHKDAVCHHLQHRYRDWFGTEFDFLIYDVTSTYFEGTGKHNKQAKHGYSRDHRPDCVQVCIGLVVTPEGLPVGYEVFDGNRNDVTTLDDIVKLMEDRYGIAHRIWVFDRGIVSEDNLEELRERGASYVVGTPKKMLRKFEQALTEEGWEKVACGVEVKTVQSPDFEGDTFILCKSPQRREKEEAILRKQADRLEAKITEIQKAIENGRLTDRAKAERRIGRWLGKYTRAEPLFEVELYPKDGPLKELRFHRKSDREAYAALVHGAYLLRTNLQGHNPVELWELYMQLLQAENAFRLSKSDLGMRPVFHQKTERVQAHIFVCFLALSMRKSLELWMKRKGLGTCARQLLNEFREIRSMDVVVPINGRNPARLRLVGRPDKHGMELLQRLGLRLPNMPKIIEM